MCVCVFVRVVSIYEQFAKDILWIPSLSSVTLKFSGKCREKFKYYMQFEIPTLLIVKFQFKALLNMLIIRPRSLNILAEDIIKTYALVLVKQQ